MRIRSGVSGGIVCLHDHAMDSSSPDPPLISIEQVKSLANILRTRGYFYRGVVPWTSHDASFLHPIPTIELDPEALWIVETTTGLCSVERLRKDFEEFVFQKQRCLLSEATKELGVDETTLRHQVLGHELNLKYYLFGGEIVLGEYLENTVALLLADVAADHGTIHVVTDLVETKLHVPFEPAFALIQEKLAQSPTLLLRRLDKGAWSIVTEKYLAKLKQNLLDRLRSHDGGPKSLQDLAKEEGWQISWAQQMIKEDEETFHYLGDFNGDIFTPAKYTREQKKSVLDFYALNGYVGAHVCQATFGVTVSMMKQYLSGVDGTVVLRQCVVSQNAVVEPLAEAIQECIASSSWSNLEPFIPLELLEYHLEDIKELVTKSMPNPDHCKIWMENSSALMFSRKFIDLVQKDEMPKIVQSAAKQKATQKMKVESESLNTSTTTVGIAKSGKEKHREREVAKRNAETHETDCDELSPALVLSDLKISFPSLVEFEDDGVLLKACTESFCTAQTNEKYSEAVASIINGLKKKRRVPMYADNDAVSTFESCFITSCHLIQAKKKFLDYVASSCSPDLIESLQRCLLQTTCRELVLRMTHNALMKANIDLSEFHLSTNLKNIDFASAVPVFAGSFISPNGFVSETSVKRLREHLPSSVALFLIKLWNVIDINDGESNVASKLGEFLEVADDVCLPICGMPFSKLDKKSEKRLLGNRANHLQAQLFRTETLSEAIDVTISIMYQQVKNYVVVSDDTSRHGILEMLSKERKASKDKLALVQTMCGKLQGLKKSDEQDLVEAMKELNTT